MKRILVTTTLIFLLLTGNFLAKDTVKPKKLIDVKTRVENLLRGVSSDNAGLRLSCAYYLGELKSEKALIPLMKMLRSDEKECNRIIAALSLFKLQNERSIYILKREAVFNDSKRTREMCGKFYDAYLMEKQTKI